MTREQLAIETWGNGPWRALLIHGLTSSGAGWWRLGAALADLGYEVIAPDLRGHGSSPRGDELTMESYRDDILALGTHWDLVLGHSLGGAIALACVDTFPQLTDRLILADPAIDSAITARFLETLPEPDEPPSAEQVAAEHPRWDPRDVVFKVQSMRQLPPDTRRRTMRDATPWDFGAVVQGLEVPTLLLAADPTFGALVAASRGIELAAANANIRFAMLEGAGHSMHRDDFAGMWERVADFLGVPSVGDELVDRGEVIP